MIRYYFRQIKGGLRLCYLTTLSTIFQLYHDSQFSLVNETGVCGENHRPAASHIMLYRVHLTMSGLWTHNFSSNRHWLYRYL